jgi:hypothetical protein
LAAFRKNPRQPTVFKSAKFYHKNVSAVGSGFYLNLRLRLICACVPSPSPLVGEGWDEGILKKFFFTLALPSPIEGEGWESHGASSLK